MNPHQKMIKKTAFALKPSKKHEGQYTVQILFFDDTRHKKPVGSHFLGQKKWKISKMHSDVPLVGAEVHDIYSFNGMVQEGQSVADFWDTYDFAADMVALTAIESQVALSSPAQVVFVLDLKSEEAGICGYGNASVIKKAEQAFLSLINQDAKNIFLQKLTSMGLQYIVLEGSIKANLIASEFFTDAEKTFFQTTAEGCKDFCQLTEFIINAFKRGEKVTLKHGDHADSSTLTLLPNDYLVKMNPNVQDFQPSNQTVTYYPPLYAEIAAKGRYTQAMQNVGFFQCSVAASGPVVVMHTKGVSYA